MLCAGSERYAEAATVTSITGIARWPNCHSHGPTAREMPAALASSLKAPHDTIVNVLFVAAPRTPRACIRVAPPLQWRIAERRAVAVVKLRRIILIACRCRCSRRRPDERRRPGFSAENPQDARLRRAPLMGFGPQRLGDLIAVPDKVRVDPRPQPWKVA
jgi:hypothetical protein